MDRTLIWKQLYYDSQPMDGRTSIPFFIESDEQEGSITAMSEAEALRWLFQFREFSQSFQQEFFGESTSVMRFYDIQEPITGVHKKPGDIDLILCREDRPDEAIAFECKRVKVTSEDAVRSKVNNAKAIRKGIKQANGLQSFGFSQSYLLIILLDDGRKLSYRNTMMRNSQCPDVEEIFEMPWNEDKHEEVGVVYIKITQPTGKHFNLMAGIGVCVDHPAGRLQQTGSLTNCIRQLFKEKRYVLP